MLKSLNHVYIDIQILIVLKFTIKKKKKEVKSDFYLVFFQKKGTEVCELDGSSTKFLCIVL